MATFRKLRLILWKNWLFRKRQCLLTFFEIILPTLFPALLLFVRNVNATKFEITYHPEYTEFLPELILHPPVVKDLMYTPDSDLSRILLQDLINSTTNYSYIGKPVANEEEMDKIALNSSANSQMLGISFVDLGNTLPKKLRYRIRYRLRGGFLWHTDILANPSPKLPSKQHSVYKMGFLWLQKMIAKRFIELSADEQSILREKQILLRRFPHPPYYENSSFSRLLWINLPLFIMISYLFVSPTLIGYIVQEKELGVKELMKLMGLPGWLQWCGWFVNTFVVMSIVALIIALLLCCNWFGILAVIPNTSPWLLLFILLLYTASSICFCFFILTLFSKATYATAAVIIIWLLSFIIIWPIFYSHYSRMSLIEKMSFMLFPNLAMTMSMQFILAFEARNLPFDWSNFSDTRYPGDDLTMTGIIFMFIFDVLLYSFLNWYFDTILPSAFGIRKPWYFIFTQQFWRPYAIYKAPTYTKVAPKNSLNFEPDPIALIPIIKIQNLTKRYGWHARGTSVVNDINIITYEGQITVLLGHNGAGKSTIMSMLAGMIPATSGSAYVNNYNIRTETDFARRDIGFCPQRDMLFNYLTVEEHFTLYGSLKISSLTVLKNEVNLLIHRLNLVTVQNTLTRNLSGGMKRRVSLGIALIGGPKVIILDEPTSRMDPEARREIWDLLHEYRTKRCLILSTHFMEEADALADRIAIMVKGQIVCCGTPIFLKKRYGVGYHLTISKKKFCNVLRIIEILKERIEGSRVSSNTVNEASVLLPMDQTSNFPDAFRELEDDKQHLGISSFGISVTTMEEVFLKVGENTKNGENEHVTVPKRIPLPINKNKGCALWFEQFVGMILKRYYYARRRWIFVTIQIFLPVLIVIIVQELREVEITTPVLEPSRVMDIGQYKRPIALITIPEHFKHWYTASFPEDTEFINVANATEHIENLTESDYPSYSQHYIVGAEIKIDVQSNTLIATAWYNGQYYHAEPLSLNLLLNAMLKYSTKSTDYSLIVENKSLPQSIVRTEKENIIARSVHMVAVSIIITIGFSFLSSSFVIFPTHERATKCKHLQFMTGVNGITFWGASFLWDLATYIVSCCLLLIVFCVADSTDNFCGEGKTEILCLVLLFYGWSTIPFSYLVSFVTTQPATAYTRLSTLHLITGLILSILIPSLLELIPNRIVDVIHWLCRCLPNFTFIEALIKMSVVNAVKEICAIVDCDSETEYLQWKPPGMGQEIFMLAVTGYLYLLIVVSIEQDFMHSIWYGIKKITGIRFRGGEDKAEKLDADVVKENERVYKILRDDEESRYALVVNNLTKKFGNDNVVDGLNFAVRNGECFGLLGVNGAGKTTTFEVLTGKLAVTWGNAFAFGKSLIENRHIYLSQIGYCPQFDALIDYMTGEEMLTIFAHLRGIPRLNMRWVINDFVVQFDIEEYAHKTIRTYSNGTKRKLSAALAFIGDPSIVFLDELTTGVDPSGRKKIWDILISANRVGTSVVLTSHSLEECDVLCSRVGIMISGQIRCIGRTQNLKNRFSQGCTILAKLKRLRDYEEILTQQQNFQEYIQSQFPSAILKDFHQGLVHYQVTDRKIKWTYLFETMEKAKVMFTLEDYSISQATLEQVFLSFAKRNENA